MIKEKYDWAVDVLIKAYLEGTLFHGWCASCAVGNLIKNASNYTCETRSLESHYWDQAEANWMDIFTTSSTGQDIRKSQYRGLAKEQIDSTGISLEELAKIEFL